MSNEEQSAWKITDPDCLQCCRLTPDLGSNVYELVQVNRFGPEISGQEFFQVPHGHIYLDDYSKEEDLEILAMFGYDTLERHDDGFPDLSDDDFNQYLAEMYFESESLEYSCHACATWNQAVDHIQKLTGLDLSVYKETEKAKSSQIAQTTGEKPRLNDLIAEAQSRTPGESGKAPLSQNLGR